MLKDSVDANGTASTADDKHYITYKQYDADGRLILTADPSAVTGYSESYNDLVGQSGSTYQYLSADSGLIHLYTYSDQTDSGLSDTVGGDVAGYLQSESVQQGYGGAPVLQESFTYYAHTAGGSGLAIHPLATDTVYRNADGTGAETTTYAYTWYSGTNQMRSQTITLAP